MKYPAKNTTDVLIIGNGFDLNLGLKTAYCDFLQSQQFEELISKDGNHLALYFQRVRSLSNWVDIENELKKYSKNETSNRPIDDVFESNFNSVSNALINYFKTIDYSLIDKRSIAYYLLRKIITTRDFYIIDFNYTNSTKLLLKSFGLNDSAIDEKLIKIHGSIEEGEIIFGVEDNSNINRHHVFLHKAYPKHYKGISIRQIMHRTRDIYFFGHSLGETDHTYFREFFNTHSDVTSNIVPKNIHLFHYGNNSYKDLHTQIYELTAGRLSSFKQMNSFNPRDVTNISRHNL